MLAPWKKSFDKPRQCVKKQRQHFANKGLYSQSYSFSLVMCGCESWAIRKAERQRIDVFELWCWRRLLRVHWTTRRSNPLILKEINPEYSLEGLMLKLKLIFWPPDEKSHWKRPWCWERLRARGEEETEEEIVEWLHWLSEHEFEQTQGDSEGQGSLAYCGPWGHKESDTTEQQNWTEPSLLICSQWTFFFFTLSCKLWWTW